MSPTGTRKSVSKRVPTWNTGPLNPTTTTPHPGPLSPSPPDLSPVPRGQCPPGVCHTAADAQAGSVCHTGCHTVTHHVTQECDIHKEHTGTAAATLVMGATAPRQPAPGKFLCTSCTTHTRHMLCASDRQIDSCGSDREAVAVSLPSPLPPPSHLCAYVVAVADHVEGQHVEQCV